MNNPIAEEVYGTRLVTIVDKEKENNARKAKMYWSMINKGSEGQKKYATFQLHKLGELDCDNGELCGHH